MKIFLGKIPITNIDNYSPWALEIPGVGTFEGKLSDYLNFEFELNESQILKLYNETIKQFLELKIKEINHEQITNV